MRYLLDTNIVSAWAGGQSAPLADRLLATPPADLCISALVQHELLYGFALKSGTRAEARTLRLLEVLPILLFGAPEARRSAILRSQLSRRGTPVGPYDLLIAATAIENSLTLVTHNIREFRRVQELSAEDWLA
ncbi:MAG: PIN domain-containing protein [Gammaproteobacteria bacterium]